MAESLKVIRIFIGSPGGLEEEREAARDIVKEVNQANSDHWGCHLKLVGWEDTLPGYQRPQARINEDLDRCEYFIGVLWDRWGTPPSVDTNGPTSGFEEEFLRAVGHMETGRMKDLVVYFKRVEVPKGMEPGEDIRKVLEFREKCIQEKKVLFRDFLDMDEFRSVVRSQVTAIGWRETEILKDRSDLTQQVERVPEHAEIVPDGPRLLDQIALDFVSKLGEKSAEWAATSAFEVARFRLIATSLGRSGNDELYLGNHDANLIFKKRASTKFSNQELYALIDCGVAGYESQNIPLWYWLREVAGTKNLLGPVAALVSLGNDSEKKRALDILRRANVSLRDYEIYGDYGGVLSELLSDDGKDPVFNAAVSYLEAVDDQDDLPILENIAHASISGRSKLVYGLIASIQSKNDPNTALQIVSQRGVEKVSEQTLDRLFASGAKLTKEALKSALSASSDEVRESAANLLLDRGHLEAEEARTLISDSSYDVRLVGARALSDLGMPLEEDEAKKVLTRKVVGGLFGRTSSNDEAYRAYQDRALNNRGYNYVKAAADRAGVLCHREMRALYERFGDRVLPQIRKNIADRHSSFIEQKLNIDPIFTKLAKSPNFDLSELTKPTLEFINSSAIDALGKFGTAKDLGTVRNLIDTGTGKGSLYLLQFLAKHGDETDIDRVLQLDFSLNALTILGSPSFTVRNDEKAKALIRLTNGDLSKLLALDAPQSIKIHVVASIAAKEFRSLTDDRVVSELNNKSDTYRIVFAARCVIEFTQERLKNLLAIYVSSDEYRYYNAIHWLDLGASATRAVARRVASCVLAEKLVS